MADGLEAEEAVAEVEAAVDGTGVATAVALEGARYDPLLRASIKAYFQQQQHLMSAQVEHLHEQFKNLKLKHIGEWLKLAMQTVTLAIGALFLAVIGGVVWQAAHSQSLVIDSLTVPPDLAEHGLSGQTLAHRIQDKIAHYGTEANSARAPASFKAGGSQDIKVEIPETGISLGELERFLREELGDDRHITGEVFQLAGKTVVATRVDGEPLAQAEGPPADLDRLLDQVSLEIFAKTEPYRYACWLKSRPEDRREEVRVIFQSLTTNKAKEERIWAWIGLQTMSRTLSEGRDELMHALELDGEFGHLWFDLTWYDQNSGHNEAALADARTAIRYSAHEDGGRIASNAADLELAMDKETIAVETGDFQSAIEIIHSRQGLPDYSNMQKSLTATMPVFFARLHDWKQAAALIGPAPDDVAVFKAFEIMPRAILAADRGAWEEAARQAEILMAETLPEPDAQIRQVVAKPLQAVAWAHLGRIAEAETLAASLPADCYDCAIARALVAELKGDRTAADKSFAEAVRQAPSLPRAWQSWGESLLARGDLDAAESKFKAAAKLGPHWADPLKGLGDVAARRGDRKNADAHYAEALNRAPNWEAAKEARAHL